MEGTNAGFLHANYLLDASFEEVTMATDSGVLCELAMMVPYSGIPQFRCWTYCKNFQILGPVFRIAAKLCKSEILWPGDVSNSEGTILAVGHRPFRAEDTLGRTRFASEFGQHHSMELGNRSNKALWSELEGTSLPGFSSVDGCEIRISAPPFRNPFGF